MEVKPIKLAPKKNGAGFVSSYTINIGASEASECGFIAQDGARMEIEKVLDTENNQIIIRLKKSQE